MAYVPFDPAVPDPATEDIVVLGDSVRANQEALRDMVTMGVPTGWAEAVSGGTDDEPQYVTYSSGVLRLRQTITWGTSGGSDGEPVTVLWQFSDDSGTSWATIGTRTYTYTTGGDPTGSTWS